MNYVFYLVTFWSFLYLVQERKLYRARERLARARCRSSSRALPRRPAGGSRTACARASATAAGRASCPCVALPARGRVSLPHGVGDEPVLGGGGAVPRVRLRRGDRGHILGRRPCGSRRTDTMAATAVLNTGGNLGGVVATPIIAALSAHQDGWGVGVRDRRRDVCRRGARSGLRSTPATRRPLQEAEMTTLQPTAAPVRPFLDWPVVDGPVRVGRGGRAARHPPQRAVRARPAPERPGARAGCDPLRSSPSFCYRPAHWDFDIGTDLASELPPRTWTWATSRWTAATTTPMPRRSPRACATSGSRARSSSCSAATTASRSRCSTPSTRWASPVHVLHIDAHLDWREEVGGVRRGYSSPLRWASTRPAVSGMTQIGLRAIGSARRAGGRGRPRLRLAPRHAPSSSMPRAWTPSSRPSPKGVPVYLTIDADGLDPTEMPAVMAPTPGGLYFRQLAPLLRALARRQPHRRHGPRRGRAVLRFCERHHLHHRRPPDPERPGRLVGPRRRLPPGLGSSSFKRLT